MNFTSHRLLAIILVSMTTFGFFSSCKKTEIKVPVACFSASNTSINIGDTIVFTNCSEADNIVIYFTTQANEETHSGVGYTFDADNTYSHVFNHSGIFTATVRASNNQAGSPIILKKESITVN